MSSNQKRVMILALVLASCTSDRPTATAPSVASRSARTMAVIPNGVVAGMAAGDVKVGSGTLDIDRVRMDRQSSPGVSVLRQYANPGQSYRAAAGETIELWVEFSGAANPRLIVNWGAGEPDSPDNAGCGSCRLTHRYAREGRYSVSVTLDDRVSTTVTRTFQIDTTLNPFADNGTCVIERLTEVGCSNGACQEKICEIDSWCCNVNWDGICVAEALAFCR